MFKSHFIFINKVMVATKLTYPQIGIWWFAIFLPTCPLCLIAYVGHLGCKFWYFFFQVCKNGSYHLRGNVYVHYKSLDSAVLAYSNINGRFFAGKQVPGLSLVFHLSLLKHLWIFIFFLRSQVLCMFLFSHHVLCDNIFFACRPVLKVEITLLPFTSSSCFPLLMVLKYYLSESDNMWVRWCDKVEGCYMWRIHEIEVKSMVLCYPFSFGVCRKKKCFSTYILYFFFL